MRLLRFARRHARGRRVWAIESSGSFGAGLTTFLLAQGEWVVEVDRPKRAARRNGAKSEHGPDHPDVAALYHNLGGVEHARRNFARPSLFGPPQDLYT
jgi:hypothetical protein